MTAVSADDTRMLRPPLKGQYNSKESSEDGLPGRKVDASLTGVRLHLGRLGAVFRGRRLVILRGVLRADNGRLQPVRIRAMVDSGATGEFITPRLAQRLGGTITHGDFGVAVEAFGGETRLTQQVSAAQLELEGVNPRSLLAQRFLATVDFTVADLDGPYDLILGTKFLDGRTSLSFHEPWEADLTDDRGGVTRVRAVTPEECREDGTAEEKCALNALRHRRRAGDTGWRQLSSALREQRGSAAQWPTGTQRRARQRADAVDAEYWLQQAARAARERPNLVMPLEQLTQEWAATQERHGRTGLRVFAIQGTGLVEREAAEMSAAGRPLEAAELKREEQDGMDRILITTVSEGSTRVEQQSWAASGGEAAELSPTERRRAEELVTRLKKEYADVFPSALPGGAPPLRGGRAFGIDLKVDAQPQGRYGARMTAADTVKAGEMIAELLKLGFIRPSTSPWGSPMFLVDKPDGSKRMVIDYRALNAQTVRNRYPLPRVDELFDQLQGKAFFSKIDLRTGCWQIRVDAKDVEKTAFTSRHGHYEWLVLPMGLTNAPAAFMALMETTFRAELNKFVLVFLDDILVYSDTFEQHEAHLRTVLQRLRDQKLYAKESKCEFFRGEVEFLGHFVGRAGVRMIEGKVQAVEQWPEPTCQKEVEQFLGLAGYYRRFIADFSKIASPLSELTGTLKKGMSGKSERKPPKKPFVWAEEQRGAFEALKAAVAAAPCLALPDNDKPFVVHADASGYATGAMLMQEHEGGMRPIAFLSKKMSSAETRYPVHEQELLAILNALRAWRHYLSGRHFTVLSDHQSLQYVETSAMATPRQLRWASWLAEFDFTIKYARGDTNVAADALSRGAAGGGRQPMAQDAMRAQEEAKLLLSAVRHMAPLVIRVRVAAQEDAEYQSRLQLSHSELSKTGLVKGGGLLYREAGGQLVVPQHAGIRTYLMSAAHDTTTGAHHGAAITTAWLKERVQWTGMDRDVEVYVRGCEQCQRNKPDNRGAQGLPMSLATPQRPWETICMDFVGPLPRTPRGHDAVMVVVDKLTRYVYYLPLRTTSTAQDVFALLERHVLAERD